MKINRKILAFLVILIVFQLPAQGFDIEKFSNPKKYGWEDFTDRKLSRMDLDERTKLLQLYEVKQKSIFENMAKSAVFPGWGHYSIGSNIKGHVFLTTELLLAGSSFYFISRMNDYYDNYKNATQINDMNSNYDKAEEHYTTAVVFVAAYAIVWLYCLYDTSESTESYNSSVWDDLINNHFENVKLSPNGIEVRF